jgi:hypothetical protein
VLKAALGDAARSFLSAFQFFPSCCENPVRSYTIEKPYRLSILSQLLLGILGNEPLCLGDRRNSRTLHLDFQFFPSCCIAARDGIQNLLNRAFNSFPVAAGRLTSRAS